MIVSALTLFLGLALCWLIVRLSFRTTGQDAGTGLVPPPQAPPSPPAPPQGPDADPGFLDELRRRPEGDRSY